MAIVSDVDTHYQKEESEKSKKGLMGSGGGIGFTVGKKKEQVEADNTKERAARSQVGSLKGNTLISTEGHYQQTGSVVTSRDAEGSATVGYGFSANGSYNQSKMNADFANVNEQTGVFAGDGGYSVNIRKHTDLKGATITSTEKAEMLGNNQFGTDTLTHQDIQNQSSYSAKGFGLDGGFSVGGGKSPQKIGDMELQQIGNNHKDGSSKVELNGIAGVASQGKPFTSVQSELTYTVFERLRAGLDMPRIFGASNASMVALLYTEYV